MHRSYLSVLFMLLAAVSIDAASVINGSFNIGTGGAVEDWEPNGKWMMTYRKTDTADIAIQVTKGGAKFNEIGFTSVKVPIAKGVYKLTVTVGGDAGTRIFIGTRVSLPSPNDNPGNDIYETVKAERTITVKYTVADDAPARIIIGVGYEENVGKMITLKGLSLERSSDMPSLTEKRIGAGTEYDGIILPKESELAETNTLKVSVVVDETKVIRKATSLLFGYNHDGPSAIAVVLKNNVINDDVIAVAKGLPMPLNRIQSFGYYEDTRWKGCLGPVEGRTVFHWNSWDKGSKKAYGPIEAVDMCLRIDPKAQFAWVVNPQDDPEDSADLVEFLTGDGSKPRGVTNWAKMRGDLGLPAPVPVVLWEFGNEVDWNNPPKRMSVTEYIERAQKHIVAIRSVDPKAKIALHAATAPWGYQQRFKEDWRDWHKAILTKLGTEIDYISFHPYYSGMAISYIEQFMDTLRDDIAASPGAGRVKVYISEHSTWPPDINKQDTWFNVQTLSASLSIAQYLNRILQRDEIGVAAYHCFTSGNRLWGLLQVGKETKVVHRSAQADLFSMMNAALGDDVVSASFSGDKVDVNGSGEKNLFSPAAMTTKDGLNLILVNREPSAPRAVDLTFKRKYALVKETVFTAPSMRSHNTEFITNSFVTEKQTAVDDISSYLMPPKSAVVLRLKRK